MIGDYSKSIPRFVFMSLCLGSKLAKPVADLVLSLRFLTSGHKSTGALRFLLLYDIVWESDKPAPSTTYDK